MAKLSDSPILPFKTPKAFEAWLAKQPADSPGVWLKIAKKDSGFPTVTYAEALEVALCHGWIDGQKGAFDKDWFVQRFSPRTARSKWSKINCDKVDGLIAAGRMKPAGLRQVEAAKADGRWDAAYAGAKTIGVPDDLTAALDKDKKAAAFFATLKGANRYAILYRIHEAKKPETRAARIAKFVAMCARGETVHG
jgi:uncharacterized protein YdeI (YjbR/CyaY-like superfamily)